MRAPMYVPLPFTSPRPPYSTLSQENISNKIGLILSFSLILIWGARLPIVRLRRSEVYE